MRGRLQQAVFKHFGHSATSFPLASIAEVFDEVSEGRADFGVVPVENSGQGTIQSTLDLFLGSPLKICGEVELHVHQFLLSRGGHTEDIERVYSHAQSWRSAAAGCARNLPGVGWKRWPATPRPRAVRARPTTRPRSRAKPPPTCTASRSSPVRSRTAPITTRFLVIGRALFPPSGNDRLAAGVRARPARRVVPRAGTAGAAHQHERIESRPAHTGKWQYAFFIDVSGHVHESPLRDALDELATLPHLELTVLGSYPVAVVADVATRSTLSEDTPCIRVWLARFAAVAVGVGAAGPGRHLCRCPVLCA